MEDAMENRTKPSPSPRPLPRGEGEPANALSRFGECRLRSHAPKLGATAARPSPARPNALAHSALPDEPSGAPSPLGRGRGEGERSRLQPQTHDDSRNCQTSRVPRQSRGIPNLV